MSPSLASMVAAGAVGMLLGGFFFEGLWLTVRHLGSRRRPVAWLTVSFVLRSAVMAGGLAAVSSAGWVYLGPTLLGVMGARAAVVTQRRPLRSASRPRPGGP